MKLSEQKTSGFYNILHNYQLTYFRYSDHSILIEWPAQIAIAILDDLLLFKKSIETNGNQSILHVVSAYHSLLVIYTSEIIAYDERVADLKDLYQECSSVEKQPRRLWKIPVCYDPLFGIDLAEISEVKNTSVTKLIRWHSDVVYRVYFIGFLPGFLYLGGLDPHLAMPRKKSPRQHIEKGAVAIGGEQTGVYPNASPGGWNIIGNSPINFFEPASEVPCFASPGDAIKFASIDVSKHQEIISQVSQGTYNLESEILYD